jgi:AraC family transcriptional regulator, regulatory protein of adaptative response / methylated-DNA-[protein]-cysteine methyltransferase
MTTRENNHIEQSEHGFPALNETECWNAIETRDTAFDGVFWYGVRTTGVYCRPSCPSRQPKRENVAFFALPDAAQRTGLRACQRCHPNEVTFRDPQAKLVRNICRLIDESVEESPDLAYLSQQVKVSLFHLQRVFKKLMGITPRQYVESRRTELFKAGLKEGQTVIKAMYDSGYGSSSRLYEKASAQLGMPPATYGKGGKGMTIAYTIVESRLGLLLVAATNRGICSVMLGDSNEELTDCLHHEFPRAEIWRDDDLLQLQVKTLLECLAGQTPHADLPLDVQGTAFQMRVWEELRRIPRGQTVSYSELANRIGKPTAARAVARACATNPVAIITPCHRVIRGNGELSGYRWGIERKRKILEKEKG